MRNGIWRFGLAACAWVVFGVGMHAFAPTLNGIKVWGLPLGYWVAAQGAPLLLAGLAVWLSPRSEAGNASWAAAAGGAAGWLTAAVQIGFIAGTMAFALGSIADRFSPRWVFLVWDRIVRRNMRWKD